MLIQNATKIDVVKLNIETGIISKQAKLSRKLLELKLVEALIGAFLVVME
jgi:hypothetical protein